MGKATRRVGDWVIDLDGMLAKHVSYDFTVQFYKTDDGSVDGTVVGDFPKDIPVGDAARMMRECGDSYLAALNLEKAHGLN